jgi:hypothetical protein
LRVQSRSDYLYRPVMALNDKFAFALSVVGENGLLGLLDLAASACTCKDAQAAIGTMMHELPVPCSVASGPLHFETVWPRECCTICDNAWTELRRPMQPHKGLPICLSCVKFGMHRALDCLTTAEARRKYQIKDLSSLQWAPHPLGFVKPRFYRESDLQVFAVRERGGATGFSSALEDRRAKVIKERRRRLVQHYHDLAELG